MRQALIAVIVLWLCQCPCLAAGHIEIPVGIRALPAVPAPSIQLTDLDGEAFDSASSQGHWLFVHFWASWCRPCREEMPAIQRLTLQGLENLHIVLINVAEDEDTVFSFLAEVTPELNSLLDRDGQVAEAWQPRGLPATYLVDPLGLVRYQALGGRPWADAGYLEFLKKTIQNRGDL